MGVGVRVAQLIGNTVEEEVPALRIHVNSQILEDVHVTAMSDATHTRAMSFGSDELYSLCTNVHNQSIDH